MAIRSRPYAAHDDLNRLRSFIVDVWSRRGPHSYFHVGDLCWRMFFHSTFEPAQRIRLWEDARGQLVGFAWFFPPNDLDIQVHPGYWSDEIAQQMLAWGEKERQKVLGEGGQAGAPASWALESDTDWIALLERSGYVRGSDCFLFMLRPLDEPIDDPEVREGFTVRNITGEAEVDRRVAVHREAFAPSRVTAESYLNVMRSPAYRTDMDLVAVESDGTFAAFCICWLDAENHVGEFEPVGAHPDYRRRGLARTVVLEGLRRLKARGAKTVVVHAWHANEASTRLYETAGFRAFTRCWRYSRKV